MAVYLGMKCAGMQGMAVWPHQYVIEEEELSLLRPLAAHLPQQAFPDEYPARNKQSLQFKQWQESKTEQQEILYQLFVCYACIIV